MAITWKLEIIPIDIPAKEARVVATRTEDEKPTRTYTLESVTLSNQSQQLLALDRIWEMHQVALALKEATANFLTSLAAQGEQNLEARE